MGCGLCDPQASLMVGQSGPRLGQGTEMTDQDNRLEQITLQKEDSPPPLPIQGIMDPGGFPDW